MFSKKNDGINLIKCVSILIASIFILPNILYVYNFGPKLSNSTEVWGQYGDFLGGFINPILSLISIVVLSYLTYTIHKIEEERINKSKEEEKQKDLKLEQIEDRRYKEQIKVQKISLLTKMRYDEFSIMSKEIRITVFGGFESKEDFKRLKEINEQIKKLETLNTSVNIFILHNMYLFGELFSDKKFIEGIQKPFCDSIEKTVEDLKNGKVPQTAETYITEDLLVNSLSFVEAINKFILNQVVV